VAKTLEQLSEHIVWGGGEYGVFNGIMDIRDCRRQITIVGQKEIASPREGGISIVVLERFLRWGEERF
jgi:hypothetical protein